MRRCWFLAIAAALAVMPVSASAASAVLTVGSASGPAVAPGDILIGTLVGSAVLENASGSEKITCTRSTVMAEDVTNPAPPGQATLTVTSVQFPAASCTTTGLFGATVTGIKTNTSGTCPWLATIDDSTNPATVTVAPNSSSGCSDLIEGVVTLNRVITFACTYDAGNGSPGQTIRGTASGSDVTFSRVPFTGKAGNPSVCIGPMAFFSATYMFVDQTQGSGAVFVN